MPTTTCAADKQAHGRDKPNHAHDGPSRRSRGAHEDHSERTLAGSKSMDMFLLLLLRRWPSCRLLPPPPPCSCTLLTAFGLRNRPWPGSHLATHGATHEHEVPRNAKPPRRAHAYALFLPMKVRQICQCVCPTTNTWRGRAGALRT